MTTLYTAWAEGILKLRAAVERSQPLAQRLAVPTPEGEEWYELLVHKLAPQAAEEPHLVVAVVGGTNIGKSVIFNQLAGEEASAVSPLAAGTKHPVCLVAPGSTANLPQLFEGFHVLPWQSPEDPLGPSPEHRLFWRVGPNVPERLLLLDTPDIDSDAEVNWQRADTIRQSADVLVAVLTQQKYNDAAVKQFFRKAAAADKPAIVVFNQCDLEDDRTSWPLWLRTFCDETGARPEHVYVAPYDRAAAKELRLPFYAVGPLGTAPLESPTSLRDDLAGLHFDAIKLRTLQGALTRVLDDRNGARSYLERLRTSSTQFADAAKTLSAAEMARVNWPSLPATLLVDEIRAWWNAGRSGWSRQIHGFYRQLGRGVTLPLKYVWRAATGPAAEPLEAFRVREREAILEAVQTMLSELERLARVGNDTLRPRLERLLRGHSRQELLLQVDRAHAELPPIDADYRDLLRTELHEWSEANPRAVMFLRSLDHAAALARPAITVSLVISGWIVAGDLVGQTAAHVVTSTAANLATEAAITGGIAGGGEAVVTATGEGVKQAAARLLRRLQNEYALRRAAWLADWLERNLLGELLTELRAAAEAPQAPEFRQLDSAIEQLGESRAIGASLSPSP